MKKILLKLTPLFLISFALNANEVQQQAQPQAPAQEREMGRSVSTIAREVLQRPIVPLILEGHTSTVKSAKFSPDGKLVVTASWDHTARIWNALDGQPVKTLKGHKDSVHSAQFSPDGKYVVTASSDKTAKIWDVETGQQVGTLEGHTDKVRSAEFSRDGKLIVTASDDHTAKIWNAQTYELLHELKGHIKAVYSAEFSPDGKQLLTASYDKTAIIWNVETGKERVVLTGHSLEIMSAKFSPDGTYVVTASSWKGKGSAQIWDVKNGQELLRVKDIGRMPNSAEFSPDGKLIVTTATDKTARIWDAKIGQQLHKLESETVFRIKGAHFSPGGKLVATFNTLDSNATLWDTQTGSLLFNRPSHRRELYSVEFSPSSSKMVTASDDGTAKIWNIDSIIVGTHFSQPIITIITIPLKEKVLLVTLDRLSRQKNGGVITKADLGGISAQDLFMNINADLRMALTSLYNLSDDYK